MESQKPEHVGDIQCFLCNGSGKLSKDRLYRELGLRQLADVAKMGVQETLDALNKDGFKFFQTYKDELAKTIEQRYAERAAGELERAERERQRHADEMKRLQDQMNGLIAKNTTNDSKIKELEADLAKARATPAKKGEQGEVDFVSFMQDHRNLRLSEKLAKTGDYFLSAQIDQPDGTIAWLEKAALLDVKKDRPIGAQEIEELARDTITRKLKIGFLIATKPEQLKGKDPIPALLQRNGVFIVTTLMEDFPRYVDLLLPFLQILALAKPEEGDEAWQAKYLTLIGEVTQAFMQVQDILDHTKKIRGQADEIDKAVEKIKKRLQNYCTTAVVQAA